MLWPATKFLFKQISSFALTNDDYKPIPLMFAYFLPKLAKSSLNVLLPLVVCDYDSGHTMDRSQLLTVSKLTSESL